MQDVLDKQDVQVDDALPPATITSMAALVGGVEWFRRPATEPDVADDLRAVAAILMRDGWARGALRGVDGSVCVLGAIARLCGALNEDVDAYGNNAAFLMLPRDASAAVRYQATAQALGRYLYRHGLDDRGSVPRWNDQRASSRVEVCEVLERCAAELDGRALTCSGTYF